MKSVQPATVDGAVAAPPSKSMMLRAVALGALAPGRSRLDNPTYCDDARAVLGAAQALGAEVETRADAVFIAGGGRPRAARIDCGESGLCLRLFAAVAALFAEPLTLTGRGSLLRRPLPGVEETLAALGATATATNGLPPLIVCGPLAGGKATLDGSETSQFLTGLLIALPLLPRDSRLTVNRLVSQPYVELTLRMTRQAGAEIAVSPDGRQYDIRGGAVYRPQQWRIEGDWSGAAFLMAAGALAGRVAVRGLDPESAQADRALLDILPRFGADVENRVGEIVVRRRERRAFAADLTDCPDLAPPLVALAVHAAGRSVLRGARRLLSKESNRAAALTEEFGKLGARIEWRDDELLIDGGGLNGGDAQCHDDHRIAMALAVAALAGGGEVRLAGDECVAKSYPAFFADLERLTRRNP